MIFGGVSIQPQLRGLRSGTDIVVATPGRLLDVMAHHALPLSVATQYGAEVLADKLRKAGLRAEPLHGHLSQGKRSQVPEDFKAARIGVVVATDLAALGIDVRQLPVMFNYEVPRSAQDYTHRIGRTGRTGESGRAISLVCPDALPHWALIVKRHALAVSLESEPGFEVTATAPLARLPAAADALNPHGGIQGKRPSKKDKLRAAAVLAASPSSCA